MKIDLLFAGVAVADFDAALPWYERLFGRLADVVVTDEEVMWNVAGKGWVFVVRDRERAGRALVTLSVDDLEHAVGQLANRGVRTEPIEVVGHAGRKAVVDDPEGNRITFIEVASATG